MPFFGQIIKKEYVRSAPVFRTSLLNVPTVLAFGISVATVEGTAAAQICTRKQNNEPTK
jgi:hypothetical protein